MPKKLTMQLSMPTPRLNVQSLDCGFSSNKSKRTRMTEFFHPWRKFALSVCFLSSYPLVSENKNVWADIDRLVVRVSVTIATTITL